MNNILEVISTRSSIRAYANENLSKDQLDAMQKRNRMKTDHWMCRWGIITG